MPDRSIIDATEGASMRHDPCPLESYDFVEAKLTHMSYIKYIVKLYLGILCTGGNRN